MFQELIALLSRFVIAVETIAANSSKGDAQSQAIAKVKNDKADDETAREEEKAPAAKEAPKRGRKPAAKKDPEDDEPAPRRGRKGPDVDFAELREKIAEIDDAINDGESNDAVDDFDDLMDEFDAKKLKDLRDEDLAAFLKKAEAIVAKYYDAE